jgi:hypothetical protein
MSIMQKYVVEGSTNTIIKTLALIIQLFRKGPNIMHYNWESVIEAIAVQNTEGIVGDLL